MEVMTKPLVLAFILVVSIQAVANAQTPESVPKCILCPTVTVSCPTEAAPIGSRQTVSGNISGGDPKAEFNYHWEVSAGRIVDGQGTSTITVEVADGTTTATLNVTGGLPAECNKTASCSFSDREPAPVARRVSKFDRINPSEEEIQIPSLAKELVDDPTARSYIIVYGKSRFDDGIKKRLARMKELLIRKYKIFSERIITIDGGLREDFSVELWIIPPGAEPPLVPPNPEL